jgi:hypothetical protein
MKTIFKKYRNTLLLLITLISFGCSSDDNTPQDPLAQLPPETQIGANTFGCIVNGQVFYPRDEQPGSGKGVRFWGSPGGGLLYNEIDVRNYVTGEPVSIMIIHLQGLHQTGEGEYIWDATNFQSSIEGPMYNYMYCRVYNESSQTWHYYGSFENSGKVTITRYDFDNRIVSGTFSGTVRLRNGTELLEIENGRFDFHWASLPNTPFP